MKVALACARFRNNDIAFNMAQIRSHMAKAKAQGAELVCFGEAFLQGFDAFSWTFENDRAIAVSTQDALFHELLAETLNRRIDLLLGFLERDGETLYSSCALMSGGKLVHLYRRVSVDWKEYTCTDEHYREGDNVTLFDYRDKKCLMALCGDLWDVTAPRFQLCADVLFWPLYITYSPEEWYGEQNERQQYADKAAEFGGIALMINCIDDDEPVLGGCYLYANGAIQAEWPPGSDGLLVVDI